MEPLLKLLQQQKLMKDNEAANKRWEAKTKVMLDLLEADPELLLNTAFKSMIEKLWRRRMYYDCVICLEMP